MNDVSLREYLAAKVANVADSLHTYEITHAQTHINERLSLKEREANVAARLDIIDRSQFVVRDDLDSVANALDKRVGSLSDQNIKIDATLETKVEEAKKSARSMVFTVGAVLSLLQIAVTVLVFVMTKTP